MCTAHTKPGLKKYGASDDDDEDQSLFVPSDHVILGAHTEGVEESISETTSVEEAPEESQGVRGNQQGFEETISVRTRSRAREQHPGDDDERLKEAGSILSLFGEVEVEFGRNQQIHREDQSPEAAISEDGYESNMASATPTKTLNGTNSQASVEEQRLEWAVEAGRAKLDLIEAEQKLVEFRRAQRRRSGEQ